MFSFNYKNLALTFICALVSFHAGAVPIHWELNGTLLQGGTAAGSFIYDADIGEFSAISLFTTSGSPSGGLLFSELAADTRGIGLSFTGDNYQDGGPNDGLEIALRLDSITQDMLTNSGGILIVNNSDTHNFAEYICGSSDPICDSSGTSVSNWNRDAINTLVGTEVPLPATAWLFLSAIGGLGIIKRNNVGRRQ